MFSAYYRSSLTAMVAGLAGFALSLLAMRAFDVPPHVVFAPGLLIQSMLNAIGADLPRRVAVFGTLAAWCLVADVVFMWVNRPWRATQRVETGR
jgi:hypothetical protein